MLKRSFFIITPLLIMAVSLIALLSYHTVSNNGDQANREFLKAAAVQTVENLTAGKTPEQTVNEVQKAFLFLDTPVRISVIQTDGILRFESDHDPNVQENYLQQPEVAAALSSQGFGSAIRQAEKGGNEFHYYALFDSETQTIVRTSMPALIGRGNLTRLAVTLVLITAAVILIMLLVGRSLFRDVIRPLQRLESATAAVAAGNLSTRVDKMLQDETEVAVLARSFNEMTARLERNVTELEHSNAYFDAILNAITDPLIAVDDRNAVTFMNSLAVERFGHDIDPSSSVYPLFYITHNERTEAMALEAVKDGRPITEELKLATVNGTIRFVVIASPINSPMSEGAIITFHDITELRIAQQIRSDFVANVTHELKTPLTSIRGFIETLRQGAYKKPELAERFIDIIDIEAERLHKLINDVLILSEIEAEREDNELESFDLRELIDSVIVLLDDQAAAKKVTLITDDEKPLMVTASRFRMKQILINLIDNAIKYNRPNGRVFISAGRDLHNSVTLRVRDTGVGIAPEHQERIFERFYRVDRGRSRELGSTGLGLSIVKHIAQLYGGFATVHSEPGAGTEFTVHMNI